MFTKRFISLTIIIQIASWGTIALLLFYGDKQKVQAIPLYQVSTPEPFLGPIYYGQEDVWQVFDHE